MKFRNGIVILEGENPAEAYQEIRSAILDNNIPLNKVIGFKLTSSVDSAVASAADRHYAMQENMIELSNNLSKLIFLPEYDGFSGKLTGTSAIVNIAEQEGVAVTSGSIGFYSNGRAVAPLDRNIYLYFPVSRIGVRLFVNETTGSKTMEENVEIMKEMYDSPGERSNEFFPLNTEHTIISYVRVLPWFPGKEIRYKLINGMTDDDLNVLWKVYKKNGCHNEY